MCVKPKASLTRVPIASTIVSLDAAARLEVAEEVLRLVALHLAHLLRTAAQVVVQLHRLDGRRARLILQTQVVYCEGAQQTRPRWSGH